MTLTEPFTGSWHRASLAVVPLMLKTTWDVTLGITVLTLPGMMEEPICITGRLISSKPYRRPEDISRKLLAILEQEIAQVFKTADISYPSEPG